MSSDLRPFRHHPLILSPMVLPLVFFLLSVMAIFSFWINARETRLHEIQLETEVTAEQVNRNLYPSHRRIESNGCR